jgi:hypothetical protein
MFDRNSQNEQPYNDALAELRQILERIHAPLDQLRSPSRPHSTNPEPPSDSRQGQLRTWNSGQLIDSIYQVGRTGQFVAHPPDAFGFSGFFPACARLEKLTTSGLEYGRSATVDISTKQILFGQTVVGDANSVSIPVQSSPTQVPFLTVHSHPTSTHARDSYHFSATDICSFLELQSLQFQVVVAEGLTLIAMRTDKTPQFNDAIKRQILELRNSTARSIFGGTSRSNASRFTREVCKMLNIALYRIKHSDGTQIAKRVIN